MADSTRPPRPRQATTAAVLGGLASLFMVLALFDVMAGLRSLEARERIADKLASPAYSDLGIDAGAVTDLLRGLLFVNGAVAAAAVVLAVYVLQRHRGARIGFGVAAGLLFVCSFVLADWLPGVPFGVPLVLAFAASMMWSPPVRDWYAGRTPAPAQARVGSSPPQDRSPDAHAAWAPPPGDGGALRRAGQLRTDRRREPDGRRGRAADRLRRALEIEDRRAPVSERSCGTMAHRD